MICYTLSDCVLKCIDTDPKKKEICTDLLGIFTQERNPHKLVVDRTGKIIDIYNDAIDDNNPAIFYWLQLMSDFPSSWEPIDVENIENASSNEDIFMKVCSQTEDKLLIVYHHNGWTKGKYYHKRNIYYDSISICVLDRTEAIDLLSLSEKDALSQLTSYTQTFNNTFITNSVVAQNGSSINNAEIK